MSNKEDYLDSLLRSVTDSEEAELLTQGPEDDFLKEYDKDLFNLDDDAFLREFEKELDGTGDDLGLGSGQNPADGFSDSDFSAGGFSDSDFSAGGFDGLDDGLNQGYEGLSAGGTMADVADSSDQARKERQERSRQAQQEREQVRQDSGDMVVNTLDGDDFSTDIQSDDLDAMLKAAMGTGSPGGADQDFSGIQSTYDAKDDLEDAELLDILAGITSDEDLEDIGNMLKANDEDKLLEGMDDLDLSKDGTDMEEGKKKRKKKGKKKGDGEKAGFFQRLSKAFFGEDEEEVAVPEAGAIEHISDENMQILMEMEQSAQGGKKEKKKKEKKKKEKKPKEPKPKKEKKPKEPKPKKEKKPKEPPVKTKPLPKVPVFLMFLLAASVVILVYLGSDLVGYNSGMSQARQVYDRGNYVEAYQLIRGMKVKDVDRAFYEKARLTSYLKQKENAYEGYAAKNMYPEALDALISIVGKYDKFLTDATQVGAEPEFTELLQFAEGNLSGVFQVSLEEAREVYGQGNRDDYTAMLYDLLKRSGLWE